MVALIALILCGGICRDVSDVKQDAVIVYFPSLDRPVAARAAGRHELGTKTP